MDPHCINLPEHGFVPNNPTYPVLVYKAALPPPVRAESFETRYKDNGWGGSWRDGVFDYHHYHSTSHEALGIAGGRASLEIGGPGGIVLDVEAGDLLVLPAGTGHRRIDASKDFLVVGAYPHGQENCDICRSAPTPEQKARIASLPAPERDPIFGSGKGLCLAWGGRGTNPETGR